MKSSEKFWRVVTNLTLIYNAFRYFMSVLNRVYRPCPSVAKKGPHWHIISFQSLNMEWKRWFSGSRQSEIEICPTQIVFPFDNANVQSLDTSIGRLGQQLLEYAQLATLFTKLYYQNRLIAAQNFILSCKLQVWALVFFTFKVQIFLTRLAGGCPVSECWPKV